MTSKVSTLEVDFRTMDGPSGGRRHSIRRILVNGSFSVGRSTRRRPAAVVAFLATLALLASACVVEEPVTDGSTPDTATSTVLGLVATLVPGAVQLTWQGQPDASAYDVSWRVRGEDAWTGHAVATTDNHTVAGLATAVAYQFRVRVEGSGETGWSGIRTRAYYDLHLPVVSISTGGVPILDKVNYVTGMMKLDPNGHDVDAYSGSLEIRGRGNSTWSMPKKPYRLKLTTKSELLDMPSNRHWVLLANALDRSQLRNDTAFGLSELTDLDWTPRFQHVEVVLNGEYLGVYQLGEHIRPDSTRVDISVPGANDNEGPKLTGGYLFEIDQRLEANKEIGFRTEENVPIVIKEPEAPTPAQFDYAKSVIDEFEAALFGPDFADPVTGFRSLIDTETLIDSYLVAELTRQQDAFWSSTFLVKPRTEKLRMGPLWDFDLSMGVNPGQFSIASPATGWYTRHQTKGLWISQMFKDPVFAQEVSDRWDELKGSFAAWIETLDETQAAMLPAIKTDGYRWGYSLANNDTSAFLQNWLRTRYTWIDNNI